MDENAEKCGKITNNFISMIFLFKSIYFEKQQIQLR